MNDPAAKDSKSAVRRWLSPGSFALACCLFFLPWLDMSCNGRRIATQTGLQACTGEFSLSKEFQDLKDKQGGAAPLGNVNVKALPAPDTNQKSEISAAPLVIVYGAVIVIGFAVAVLFALGSPVTPNAGARILPALLGGIALLVLLVQSIIGFPMSNKVKESNDQSQMKNVAQGMPQPVGADQQKMADAMKTMIDFKVNYLAGFWLSLRACALPVLWFGFECTQIKPRPRSRDDDRPPSDSGEGSDYPP